MAVPPINAHSWIADCSESRRGDVRCCAAQVLGLAMKSVMKISLGILTSVGGYLEAGSIGTALQAGAMFRFALLWPVVLGTICIAFLLEMSGRVAAVSRHTIVDVMRNRFGLPFQIWPFGAQLLVDLVVLASEIGGAAMAMQIALGGSARVWAIPMAVLVWALLWFATFNTIENGVALLGLVTLCFVAAVFALRPDVHAVAAGLIPRMAHPDAAQYGYLAVAILGATISPYLVTFYSSGAVEEKWSPKNLSANRMVAAVGMAFGGIVGLSVIIVSALILAPRGLNPQSFTDAAGILDPVFGRAGMYLFAASLGIGCVGAGLELSLDLSYLTAQTFGWEWGENQQPSQGARFALTYTAALVVSVLPTLIGIDPLSLTMASMAFTVIALPVVIGPLLIIMNDPAYLKSHTNGRISNIAVGTIILIGLVLAVLSIPLQFVGRL